MEFVGIENIKDEESVSLESITISSANAVVTVGNNIELKAIGTYSDNSTLDITTAASWSSSDSEIAMISNENGLRLV